MAKDEQAIEAAFDSLMEASIRRGSLTLTEWPRGDKCAHKPEHGRYIVEWRGDFYEGLEHKLALQMWYSAENELKARQIKAVRWLCFDCQNVQEP